MGLKEVNFKQERGHLIDFRERGGNKLVLIFLWKKRMGRKRWKSVAWANNGAANPRACNATHGFGVGVGHLEPCALYDAVDSSSHLLLLENPHPIDSPYNTHPHHAGHSCHYFNFPIAFALPTG